MTTHQPKAEMIRDHEFLKCGTAPGDCPWSPELCHFQLPGPLYIICSEPASAHAPKEERRQSDLGDCAAVEGDKLVRVPHRQPTPAPEIDWAEAKDVAATAIKEPDNGWWLDIDTVSNLARAFQWQAERIHSLETLILVSDSHAGQEMLHDEAKAIRARRKESEGKR